MKFITLNLEEERVENTYTIDKCIRKDKLNGLATVEFSTLNNHLEKYYRLLYKNHKGKWKEFIITSIEMIHTNEGIEYLVYAEDSIVEIKGDFIEDKRNRMATYSACAKKVFEDTRWRLIAESSLEKHNLSFYRQSAFKSFNDILQKFSCEYETLITVVDSKVTDRVVHLTNRLGHDLGKRFSWSKDMDKISKKVNEYEVITALYPYGNGEEIGEGYGRRIDISEVNNGVPYLENNEAKEKYGFLNPDGSRRHRFGKREYDTDDKAELKKLGQKDLDIFSKPAITYTATVIDLKNYGIDLDGVDIGDIVSIRDKEANITLRARVLELEEDLDNIEETTIVLGNYRPIFGSSLNNMKDSLSRLESKEGVYDSFKPVDPGDQSFIDIAIENLNKSFNSGTSNIFFDKNRGLVVTDKPNEKDSNWIMELSSQGFRIANSKKSNGEWDFRTFGTGDGFTADQLITGIIRGGKSFWNLETGELDIGGIFKVDGSGSGSLELKGIGLADKTEILSGTEIYTDKADDSVVHVEVDGKSYQEGEPSPDYPIEIHSLNDFDVVSQKSEGGTIDGIEVGGRNLAQKSGGKYLEIPDSEYSSKIAKVKGKRAIIFENNGNILNLNYGKLYGLTLEINQEYTFSFYARADRDMSLGNRLYIGSGESIVPIDNEVATTEWKRFTFTFTAQSNNLVNFHLYPLKSNADGTYDPFYITDIKLEKGNTATDWTPAPEDITESDNHPLIDKINLSLGEPLRSVGDVKDRLFRDSDGLWKIDRNIGAIVFDGSEGWSMQSRSDYGDGQRFSVDVSDGEIRKTRTPIKSSHFTSFTGDGHKLNGAFLWGSSIFIYPPASIATTVSQLKSWLATNNVEFFYLLDSSKTETLDQGLQDKLNNLRSFQDSNYIYTIINDKTDIISENLKPTLHATFKGGGWYERFKIEKEFERHQNIIKIVEDEISSQPEKWQGDIDTNVANVMEDLTGFQSDLTSITRELTGKANIEEVLNQEEIENIINSILKEYPDLIKLNQHFSFDTTNGLQITATDASNNEVDTSVLIKNDGLTIEVEGQTAAYFKQNETLTPNLNVEGTAWVGNHAMLGFNGYDADGSYNENKNITVFAWSPRKKEEDS